MKDKFKLYCCIYTYSRISIDSKLKELKIHYSIKEIKNNDEVCELYLLEDNFTEDSGKVCDLVNHYCKK